MTNRLLTVFSLLTLAASASGQPLPQIIPPRPTPATAPAPAATSATVDPKAVATLELLEKRDQTLKNFTARFVKRDYHRRTDDTEINEGLATYAKAKDPATGKPITKLYIHFTKQREEGGTARARDWTILFDGTWLYDIDADASPKKFKKTQLVPPGATFNPTKLGEGPLPLPIGQDTKEILRDYNVALFPADPKSDPKGYAPADLVRLKLDAKKLDKGKFNHVELWVDPKPGIELPIQIRTTTPDEQSTITLSDIKTNLPSVPEAATPATPKPGTGWEVTVEPYREQK